MTLAASSMFGLEPEYQSGNRGFSLVAQTLCDLIENAWGTDTSVAQGDRYRALEDATTEAMAPNWDGYGARPVDRPTYQKARAFLRALPKTLPDPEIGAEPGGQIALEWYRGPRRVFTISIRGDGDLSYAMLLGREKTHGTAYFVGEIPGPVAYFLGRFVAGKTLDR